MEKSTVRNYVQYFLVYYGTVRKYGIIFFVQYSFRKQSFEDKKFGFDFAEIIALNMLYVLPIFVQGELRETDVFKEDKTLRIF